MAWNEAFFQDVQRARRKGGQRGVLGRGGGRDEEVLGELFDLAHVGLRHHHPAKTPAGHAKVLRKAVHHDHVVAAAEGGARLDAVVEALVNLVDDQHATAGGNGDTTGLLASLVAHDAPGSVLGLLIDPASAKQAHEVGERRRKR